MGTRPQGEPPAYRRWKRRGQIVGYATDRGSRVTFPGAYNSRESRAAYERWRSEWVRLHELPAPPPCGREVGDLVEAFLTHARDHYRRPDGTPTDEPRNFVMSFRELLALHADTVCDQFGPLDLETVRRGMIRAGLSRGVINQRVGRIVRLFRWGMGRELVRPETVMALTGLEPLARGRSAARETPRVLPVAWEAVEATLPFLACDELRAMVRTQWWAGCRPGQVCTLRGEDVYQSGAVELGRKVLAVPAGCWLWAIDAKMAALRNDEDREEVYVLGESAQEVLKPWLRREGYLFATDRSACYQETSYAHAVRNAINKARAAGVSVPRWWPHQLRHAAAERVQKALGIEAARAVLNHRSVNLTVHYSQRDIDLAAEAARRLG